MKNLSNEWLGEYASHMGISASIDAMPLSALDIQANSPEMHDLATMVNSQFPQGGASGPRRLWKILTDFGMDTDPTLAVAKSHLQKELNRWLSSTKIQ